jgi:hypothetical protein
VPEPLGTWLALREAADAAARSRTLTEAAVGRLRPRTPVRAVDLGTGTGSNVRYLAAFLGPGQEWLVVDRDESVLAGFRTPPGVHVERRREDLDAAVNDRSIFAGRCLVTASALLDLVSARWVESLAQRCAEEKAVALFALTYDGRSSCEPVEHGDDEVRRLLNRHQQRRLTATGYAAGPDAVDAAAAAFGAVGYEVRRERSDWRIGTDSAAMQRELFDVWAAAARETAPDRTAAIDAWLASRLEHLRAGRSTVAVGHEDLGAWPPASRISRS